ncbi:MAG: hypothetical protein ACJ8M1_01545 [Chthoniobacterales bacterium]
MSNKRWTMVCVLIVIGLVCGMAVFRIGAANPTSGTISVNSAPVSWTGTAAGGTYNGEGTCVDGANCDAFTLTVIGTPAQWTGKRIQVAMSWLVLANDYDLYIHKGAVDGPIVAQSAHGAPSTTETAFIEPGDLDDDGSTTFTVHVGYFTGSVADEYHCQATVVPAFPPPPPAPPRSPNWVINYHGECCEGNLSAAGNNTFVLLPVLVNGNRILKSSDGGKTWTQKYPPAPASVPFGIEGDMQAFGTDVIFFGTELGVAVTAHSDDFGETFVPVQNPLASAGNDQAWSYLGPFGDLRPGGKLPNDEPYVLAGWMRIGASLIFSFDGGLTYPIQTPLVGDDGSGPIHTVCRNSAHAPNDPGDTRVPNADFARHKGGRHGTWGTDRQFYWTEPADGANPGQRDLYVCKTGDFGVNWTGIKHSIRPGPASDFVVSHSAFDQNGTFYVLHGDKLYVSFNQGESFAFVHTLPRYGSARRSDAGSDQSFVVDCGTAHIGVLEDANQGNARVYYLRGSNIDTATPTWEEEFVDEVGSVRLDFLYIVLDGNGIPTISYTTPDKEVTTASRLAPTNTNCLFQVTAASRKVHGGDANKTFDIPLGLIGTPGVECRRGTPTGKDYQVVFKFAAPIVSAGGATVTSKDNMATADGPVVSGTEVAVNLHNVSNAQTVVVTLTNVNDGAHTGNVGVPMSVLLGDIDANRNVSGSDVNLCKSKVGATLSQSNFRTDVDVTGDVSGSDVNITKSKVGSGLP